MTRSLMRGGAFLAAATVLMAPSANAQGFGVYEQGACVMGRAGTGVASPCSDGSTIFFNPANLTRTPDVISGGGTLILPRGGFTNDLTGLRSDMLDKVRPVPNLYFVKGFPLEGGLDHLSVGVGVFVPYGLTTEWPDTSEARFLGYRTDVRALYVQPTAAVRFGQRFSVGAGLDINFAHLELKQRADLSQLAVPGTDITFGNLGVATGTDFADADLEANTTHVGFHVGLGVQVTDWLDVGARYLSRQTVSFDDGSVKIAQVPTGLVVPAALPGIPAGTPVDNLLAPQFTNGVLTDQSASTKLTMPDQFVAGVAVRPAQRLTLLSDVQYTHWKLFDSVSIAFEKLPTEVLHQDNHDVWGFRLGGEFAATPGLTLRGGWYIHDGASADYAVVPNLPEGDRSSFTVGFGTRVGTGFRIDAAYQYIDQGDRRGRTVPLDLSVCPGGTPCPALVNQNNGLYQFHAHLFGATFSYEF
jgi:long-chain fatty acid transport protein